MNFPKSIKIQENLELHFSEPTFENAKEQFLCVVKNRNHLLPYLEWAHENSTRTPEDTFRFLDKTAKEWENQTRYEFGIILDNAFVGRIGIFNVDKKTKSCELGFWLDKDFTGKGIITKSVKAIEKILFEEFKINRIVIGCDKKNTKSAKVAMRCGYKQEAELEESRLREFYNTLYTHLVFAKLKKDYK